MHALSEGPDHAAHQVRAQAALVRLEVRAVGVLHLKRPVSHIAPTATAPGTCPTSSLSPGTVAG